MTPPRDLRSTARRVLDMVRSSGPLWAASLAIDRVLPFGVLGLWRDRIVSAELLSSQLEAVLRAWGMSPEHIAITIEHMLYADRHGIDSHGSSMLLHYHRGLVGGWLSMTPKIEVVRESETTAVVDGGGGLGHVPADMAMKLAIEKARANGLASVVVRNSGHFGAAGCYASMAAKAGLIGIATTNTREPALVPTFGTEALLGTNPIALAAPTKRNPPFLLDMATSTASLGKLMTAWRKGKSLPRGWALRADGSVATNPRRAALGRRLTPLGSDRVLGSHKGYGLATAIEVLSSTLPGGDLPNGAAQGRAVTRIGHCFIAIDPRRFREDGAFESDLDVLIDELRACRPVDPREPVQVPGDPEYAAYAERTAKGIPLSRPVIEDIRTVARASGVPFLLDEART